MSIATLEKEKVTYKSTIADIEKEVSEGSDSLVIELCDSKPSNFVMDGPGTEDFANLDKTAVVSFPSLRRIRNISRVAIMDKNLKTVVYKKIRYIKGSTIIDMEKQASSGIQPNALADQIYIRNGHAEVTKSGDIGLYLYLSACEYNTESKYRPEDAEDIFKVINTMIGVKDEEDSLDAELAAMNYLSSLKWKVKGQDNGYNTDAIEFLCSIFKLPSYDSGYTSEAWVALATKARENPAKFINSVASSRAIYEGEVNQAIEFGVINVDREKAFLSDGGKIITVLDSDNNREQNAMLIVDFLSNPKNRIMYDEVRTRLNTAKAKKLEIQ